MRRNPRFLWLLTGLFALLPICNGCALKGDPVPPKIKLPTAINDLRVESLREGILLAWSVDPLEKIGTFRILRTEPVPGIVACPGCPQEYRPLRTIPLTDTGLRSEEGKKYYYIDWDVRDGYFYSYRIALCDKSERCGALSNEAGLIHGKEIPELMRINAK
jgi:hypothetical protein